jgi:hypothetical protein
MVDDSSSSTGNNFPTSLDLTSSFSFSSDSSRSLPYAPPLSPYFSKVKSLRHKMAVIKMINTARKDIIRLIEDPQQYARV